MIQNTEYGWCNIVIAIIGLVLWLITRIHQKWARILSIRRPCMKSTSKTKRQGARNWRGFAKGENQNLIFAQLCWILVQCPVVVLCPRIQSFSWILVCNTCRRVHEVRTGLLSSTYLLRWQYVKEKAVILSTSLTSSFPAKLADKKNTALFQITRSVA